MGHSPIQAGALVGQKLGKYKILALLALGGTAEIYLARIGGEAGFEKYVVVKCLLDHLADEPDYVRMFLDEARLCAQLEHSNIVQTLELGQHQSRYYMVMEYLAGMSLAQLARKTAERVAGGLLPIDIVLSLAAQTASGLHYAHERTDSSGAPLNVVHRDVSPQNLVVTYDGILKIVDFGIAKAEDRETHTRTGTIKGKFAYMSPEQCQAQAIDRRTDIFALGVIVHELLTGRRLFKRGSSYETYQAITSGKYPAPSAINHRLDPALDDVVMRAVAFKKEDRYPNAEEFGEALLSMLHRRGRSVGAADISRYYDEHFDRELEEHGERMRHLIEGRAESQDEAWDDNDIEFDAKPTTPPSPRQPAADDGATRVEMNPLDERARAVQAGPADTKEGTRPTHSPRGKSAGTGGLGVLPKVPPIGGGGTNRKSDESTREISHRKPDRRSITAETRDAGGRRGGGRVIDDGPTLLDRSVIPVPPAGALEAAPTREELRAPVIPPPIEPPTVDENIGDEDATVLKPHGGYRPSFGPDSSDLALAKTSALSNVGAGSMNRPPEGTGTGDRTRPHINAPRALDPAVAPPPLFTRPSSSPGMRAPSEGGGGPFTGPGPSPTHGNTGPLPLGPSSISRSMQATGHSPGSIDIEHRMHSQADYAIPSLAGRKRLPAFLAKLDPKTLKLIVVFVASIVIGLLATMLIAG